MNRKEIFYQDKENCKLPFTHIMNDFSNSSLDVIDELYGAADVLSIMNAQKYQKILLALAVVGTVITFLFLLYDSIGWYGLILACGAMICVLFGIYRFSNKLDCHKKYLEYRVLAESLRVQYFLSIAGVKKPVVDILPWFIKKDIPFVEEILLTLPEVNLNEKRPIIDFWIRDQKEYHKSALVKSERKRNRDNRISRIVLFITIISYILACIFEILVMNNFPMPHEYGIRLFLKVILGTMSAITLFSGSYYGKMSLSNVIGDHRRMISLYEKAENDVSEYGETEELLLFLAREFLIENSTWYSYQSKNEPNIVI